MHLLSQKGHSLKECCNKSITPGVKPRGAIDPPPSPRQNFLLNGITVVDFFYQDEHIFIHRNEFSWTTHEAMGPFQIIVNNVEDVSLLVGEIDK